ncbi:hypothetical protein AVEN_35734-1, partial [Araneus ventricosus]
VELNCEIRKIDSDVEDKMHDIEYNSPNRRKIAKSRNLFNSPAKLIEISNKYEVLNSEEINETIEVNDNSDNSKQAAEEPGKVEKRLRLWSFCAECEEDSVTGSATFLFALQETSPVLRRTSYLGKGTTDKKMPEGAGVTVPNEPDGNSYLDEQMEMSPSLAANPTPIQVSKEIPDLTPFFRRAVATYEKPVSDLPYSR